MTQETTEYVVCVRNEDYRASLELRKIYEVRPDPDANAHGLVGFAARIPTFVMAPFAGVLIDRVDRHRLVILTQVLSMA